MLWLPMYQAFVEVNFQNIEHNDLTNILHSITAGTFD